MKKILVTISNVVSTVIILLAVLVLVNVVMTRSGEAPQILGYSMFRVMSGSMEPALPVNAVVVVKRTPAEELAVGDVISFYSQDPQLDGMVNTHRITAIEQEGGDLAFSTKGDANVIQDELQVFPAQIIGKVVYCSAFLGLIIRLLANPIVFLPLILVPLAIILIVNVVSAVKSVKAIMREEEEEAYREALEKARRKKAEMEAAKAAEETPEKTDPPAE